MLMHERCFYLSPGVAEQYLYLARTTVNQHSLLRAWYHDKDKNQSDRSFGDGFGCELKTAHLTDLFVLSEDFPVLEGQVANAVSQDPPNGVVGDHPGNNYMDRKLRISSLICIVSRYEKKRRISVIALFQSLDHLKGITQPKSTCFYKKLTRHFQFQRNQNSKSKEDTEVDSRKKTTEH